MIRPHPGGAGTCPAVGVRYCGGCNPRYDRVAAVAALRTEFPGLSFQPVAPGQGLTLLVCGCETRCVAADGLTAPPVYLCGAGQLAAVRAELARLQHSGKETEA